MTRLYYIVCDHRGCDAAGPDEESETLARERVMKAGWQRWRRPPPRDDELLDLCPDHHKRVAVKIARTAGGPG